MDTSAVLKLVVQERESSAAAQYISSAAAQGHQLVASMQLHTELHCAAHRRGFPGEPVNTVLGAINLVDLVRSDLMYAAALPASSAVPTPFIWPQPSGCSPTLWWPMTPG
ncbi:hypothetical protein ACQCSV_06155 [Pseudarthrobacter sp. S3]|uniref:hypothetical protein n=1 Tax=Pseudarthrobacter sp. S3 TaxID=3418419 RepID=UPI003CF784BC